LFSRCSPTSITRAVRHHRTVRLYGCTVPSMAWMYPSTAIHDTAICRIEPYKNGHYGHMTAVNCHIATTNRTNPWPYLCDLRCDNLPHRSSHRPHASWSPPFQPASPGFQRFQPPCVPRQCDAMRNTFEPPRTIPRPLYGPQVKMGPAPRQ